MKKVIYVLIFSHLALYGQGGYSISFDGQNDYGEINGSSSNLISDDSFTIEVWYKNPGVDSETGHYQNTLIFSNYFPGAAPQISIDIYGSGDEFAGHAYFNGNGLQRTMTTHRIDDGEWHHITGVYDTENFESRLYLDGELQEANEILDVFNLGNNHTFMFGSGDRVYANNRWMGCNIGSIKLSNLARYSSNFTSCEHVIDSNTVGLWNFNEGSGNTVYDISGNENHGVIHGATFSEDVPEQNCDENNPFSNQSLNDGLVAYYPFDGNANDESGNGNHGIVNGPILSTDRFEQLSAYSFDGIDDNISISNDTSLTILGDISISSWVKTQGYNDVSNYQTILSKRAEYYHWEYSCCISYHAPNDHDGHFITAKGNGPNIQDQLWSQGPADVNEWEHWVAVYSEDSIKIYRNGVFDSSRLNSVQPVTQNCDILIGQAMLESINEQFFGSLDDIGIWDRALNENEVLELYMQLEGCTDSLAFNYNADANLDDGSCYPVIEGCINPIAANYVEPVSDTNIDVNTDDGSCLFSAQVYNDITTTNSNLEEELSVFETVEQEQDYSLSLDGIDDYVEIPMNNLTFDGLDEFTLTASVNNAEVQHSPHWSYIVTFFYLPIGSTNFNGGWSLRQGADGGNGAVGYRFDIETTDAQVGLYSVANQDEWQYLTITYDGSKLRFYENSTLHSEQALTGLMTDFNGNMYFGFSGHNTTHSYANQKFHGLIDDVSIWNRALSQEEVQSYQNCSTNLNGNNLLSNWNFNEGSGDTVYDISGNGNHGIIYGGAEFSEDTPISYNGCTDANALNFDAEALCDNGSCVYGDDLVSSLEDSFNQTVSALNNDIDSTSSTLNNVLDTWQSSIDLTNSTLDEVSLINQTLSSFNTVIDLSEGWNMFGYGCPQPMDVAEGLSSYTDLIIITKDNNGAVYMPQFSFNGIGSFSSGYGYQIKISEAIEGFSLCGNFTDIDNTEILDIETDNAQMQNDINCLTGNPEIGDHCYGGIVFYVEEGEEGKYGLVAAMEDLTEGATDPYGEDLGYEWGCYGESLNGLRGTSIGTGFLNTMDIVNQGCSTENGGITAAQAAIDVEINGYTDWFLPSLYELQEIYNTIGNGGSEGNLGSFNNMWYWSSSEYNTNTNAWYIHFNSGVSDGMNYRNKFKTGRVRVIRAFGNWTMGCMDETACNYNPEANMADGSCNFAQEGYDCDGNDLDFSLHLNGQMSSVGFNDVNIFSSFENQPEDFSFLIDLKLENEGIIFQSYQGAHSAITFTSDCGCDYNNEDFSVPSISFRVWSGGTQAWTITDVPISEIDTSSFISVAATYTYNSRTLRLYINGVMLDTEVATQQVQGANNDDFFGTGSFTGLIDNFSVFNYALSSEEIQNYMICRPSGVEVGLAGYWDFNEGQGDTIYDLTENENHGTTNGIYYSTDSPENTCE